MREPALPAFAGGFHLFDIYPFADTENQQMELLRLNRTYPQFNKYSLFPFPLKYPSKIKRPQG
jgi:hypothetical protein